MPGMAPVVGFRVGYAEHISTPAMAARAEPMAKVTEMVRFTLTPISCAAPLSSDTQRMARPILVRPTKSERATITTTDAAMVTMET